MIHLALALNDAGWHPAAWREPGAGPADLFTLRHWAEEVRRAEAGQLDLVTFEDSLGLQLDEAWGSPRERTDRVRGRLDSVLVANAVAPLTSSIGLVPSAVAVHTEPFHLAKAIATLDHVSRGRAGVRVRATTHGEEARHIGRRPDLEAVQGKPTQEQVVEQFAEASDWVEVLRRLWDSWEDDAEIRDVATGRFVDRDKLHYIDFEGKYFSVKGPLITQRPPQGQPIVAALAHQQLPYEFVAASADLGFITPFQDADLTRILSQVPDSGRERRIFADLLVVLDDTAETARARLDRLNEAAGEELVSDTAVFTGTVVQLADKLEHWHSLGVDGFRLRPAVSAQDGPRITHELTGELRRRGQFRDGYQANTLRGLLGFPLPTNRYAHPSPLAS